jgi:hypothetical protein
MSAPKIKSGTPHQLDEQQRKVPLPSLIRSRGAMVVSCALRDAGNYIAKLPKRDLDVPAWQAAMQALLLVAEYGGDIRAAVNAYHAEHALSVVPKITLPPKAEGRHRWLTRNEAARLLGAAIGHVWDNERETWKRREDGTLLRHDRWIIRRRCPAARFTLIGIYLARREETTRRTWVPTTTHPWMDLDAMMYQGKGASERSTKKRRPPAKIANRLRPHLARWRTIDERRSSEPRSVSLLKDGEQIRFVVNRMHDRQLLAGKIRSAWEGIPEDAGPGGSALSAPRRP